MRPAQPRKRGLISALLCLVVVAIGLIGLDPAVMPALAAEPENCTAMNTEQVKELFERWNSALGSGDPRQVSALYSDDALLLPTLSATSRANREAITDYFATFLAQAPEGRIDTREIRLGCNQALDAGTYSFLLHPPAEEPRRVQARYTFVYVYRNGDWRILHHHSSLMPET
jgi:uncharacterized protein (TIGR02246 family)